MNHLQFEHDNMTCLLHDSQLMVAMHAVEGKMPARGVSIKSNRGILSSRFRYGFRAAPKPHSHYITCNDDLPLSTNFHFSKIRQRALTVHEKYLVSNSEFSFNYTGCKVVIYALSCQPLEIKVRELYKTWRLGAANVEASHRFEGTKGRVSIIGRKIWQK